MNAHKELSINMLEKIVSDTLDTMSNFDDIPGHDKFKQDLQLLYAFADKINLPSVSRLMIVVAASLAKLDPNILVIVKDALNETTDKIMKDVVEYSLIKE